MTAIAKRIKIADQVRDGINLLTEIGKDIYGRVEGLAEVLGNVEEYFTNSGELAQLMHKNGINMRYLGQLL